MQSKQKAWEQGVFIAGFSLTEEVVRSKIRQISYMKIQSLFRSVVIVFAISLLGFSFFIPQVTLAQTNSAVSGGAAPDTTTVYSPNELDAGSNAGSANVSLLRNLKVFGQDTGMSSTDPRVIAARLIKMAMGFVGIIVLIMILGSGLMFMTAGGDEEKTSQAKRTFFNAIIGLIIILSAYSIVTFVLNALTTASGASNTTSTAPAVPDPITNP
mgnify:CR=1 FL=1